MTSEQPGREFDDFNTDPDMWSMPCCGADYDCACEVVAP